MTYGVVGIWVVLFVPFVVRHLSHRVREADDARLAPAIRARLALAAQPRQQQQLRALQLAVHAAVRASLLVVLVLGHLFVNLMLGEGIHRIDFAFVAGKWANPFWQVWDLLMLWLAMLHGSNGLRTIINDYAEQDDTRFCAQDAALLRRRRRDRARHAGDLHLRPVHRPELHARRLPTK